MDPIVNGLENRVPCRTCRNEQELSVVVIRTAKQMFCVKMQKMRDFAWPLRDLEEGKRPFPYSTLKELKIQRVLGQYSVDGILQQIKPQQFSGAAGAL